MFPANEYPPFASEDIALFDAFLGDMSDGYSYQNKDLVYTAVHTYLQKCSQQRMPPKWVIETYYHCAERMLLVNRPAKDNTALLTLSQQLHMADSASQLAELLLQFLFETATPDSALMSSKKDIQKVLSYIESHYTSQLRMERSAQFIRENSSNCNIREAASSVGIEDPFYFTRKFKAYWGKSPSEYAKNNE